MHRVRVDRICALVEQLQVGDRHFALLAASLPHQPIGIHAWDTANRDHLVSQQGELTAAGSVVVIKDSGFAAAVGAAQLAESARRAATACGDAGQRGGHGYGGHRDAGSGRHGRLVVVGEGGWETAKLLLEVHHILVTLCVIRCLGLHKVVQTA